MKNAEGETFLILILLQHPPHLIQYLLIFVGILVFFNRILILNLYHPRSHPRAVIPIEFPSIFSPLFIMKILEPILPTPVKSVSTSLE